MKIPKVQPLEVPRLSIEKTREVIIAMAPTCIEVLHYFQSRGKWLSLPAELVQLRSHLKIDNYVDLYLDERRIGFCVLLALMEPKELLSWSQELESMSAEDQQRQLDSFASVQLEEVIEFEIPWTEEEKRKAKSKFDALSPEEQQRIIRSSTFLFSAFLAGFHNLLSVMIHGQKLTTLVPKAIAGDDDALCKALQIDPHLYKHHQYFVQRIDQARANGEADFLRSVGYRLANPTARGKIRYPGLWTVLAILDTLGWLDGSLSTSEVLDICDAVGLDRYENRIEDPQYLSKRIRDFRRLQGTPLVSSH